MSGDNSHAPLDWGVKEDEMTLEYRCSNCGTLLATTNADPLHDEIERLNAKLDNWVDINAAAGAELERLTALNAELTTMLKKYVSVAERDPWINTREANALIAKAEGMK
jgi:hypothetical protein